MKKASLATRLYKISNLTYQKRIPLLPQLLFRLLRVLLACEIPYQAKIGEGTVFIHNGLGTVIHPEAQIGKCNKIMHNVTIGGRNGRGAPIIGDFCFIGVGACILGDVTIGNNVMIGANAVVMSNIPDNVVVAGVPARIIKQVDKNIINKFKE